MSNQRFHKSSLDDAIDNAVREIIQIDPRPGLRRRVLSQLDAPAESRSWIPRLLLPLGGLACIALAILTLTPERPPVPAAAVPTATAAAAPVAGPPASPDRAASSVAPPGPSASASTTPRVSRRSRPRVNPTIFGPRGDRVSAASVRPGTELPGSAVSSERTGGLPPLVLPALIIEPLNLAALPGRIR